MKKILLLLICSLSAFASELVVKGGGLASHKLGNIDLIRTDKGYEILKANKRIQVKDYDIDPLLKKLDKKKLATFFSEGHGYTEVSQLSNGDYKVRAHVRGQGGGAAFGAFVYWATKSLCYGTIAAGVSAGLVATGGMAGGAIAGAATLSAGPGTAVVAGAIGANAAASQAAMLGATCAVNSVGVAGVATAIEALALTLGTLAGMTPTP